MRTSYQAIWHTYVTQPEERICLLVEDGTVLVTFPSIRYSFAGISTLLQGLTVFFKMVSYDWQRNYGKIINIDHMIFTNSYAAAKVVTLKVIVK